MLQNIGQGNQVESLLRQLPRHAGQACTVVLSQVERDLSHAEVTGKTEALDALWARLQAMLLSLARTRGSDGTRALALEDMDAVFMRATQHRHAACT